MEVARMTNAGNKKLLVVLLALALFACSVMALGGTFATQVDKEGTTLIEDTNGPTVLNYKVALTYSDSPEGTSNNLLSVKPYANTLWCPGYTKIIYVEVVNNEAFPVECTLNFDVTANGFDDKMTYAVLAPDSNGELTQYSNWDSFYTAAGTKSDLKELREYPIFTDLPLTSEASTTYAVAIHMSEDASNQYQNKQLAITVDFRVDANYATGTTVLTDPQ